MNKYQLVALGELLIDFTPVSVSGQKNLCFERNPGGAPGNVLAAFTKLGGKSAFLGMVGNDQFGHYLKSVIDDAGISSEGLKFTDKANTTLAFVHLDENGDRSFSFYRHPGADIIFEEKDINFEIIKNCNIFHFGSLSMTDEPSRSATFAALKYAKENGKLISYDPNWRPLLWPSEAEGIQTMKKGLEFADILKISEVEAELLTGTSDIKQAAKELFSSGISLVVVTLGKQGCYYHHGSGKGLLNTYNTSVVDTTGAGDAFLGGLLYQIQNGGCRITDLDNASLLQIMDFANAVGALCASGRGAIPAMPQIETVLDCLKNTPKLVV